MGGSGHKRICFIVLIVWAMVGFACHGKYRYRTSEGIVGPVGVNLDIDPVVPIEGPNNRLVYPVKFICGNFMPQVMAGATDPDGPLSPGTYLTAVNIVNPIDSAGDASLDIRATQTFIQDPGNGSGIVGAPVTKTLAPYHGLEIDCGDIRDLLGNPTELFLKGFVLIETTQPLSVVPVYTVQNVEEDFATQTGRCASLAWFARYAIINYEWRIANFILSGADPEDCDELRDAHQLANDNTKRCQTVCGEAACPENPEAPGLYPGTENCTRVD